MNGGGNFLGCGDEELLEGLFKICEDTGVTGIGLSVLGSIFIRVTLLCLIFLGTELLKLAVEEVWPPDKELEEEEEEEELEVTLTTAVTTILLELHATGKVVIKGELALLTVAEVLAAELVEILDVKVERDGADDTILADDTVTTLDALTDGNIADVHTAVDKTAELQEEVDTDCEATVEDIKVEDEENDTVVTGTDKETDVTNGDDDDDVEVSDIDVDTGVEDVETVLFK